MPPTWEPGGKMWAARPWERGKAAITSHEPLGALLSPTRTTAPQMPVMTTGSGAEEGVCIWRGGWGGVGWVGGWGEGGMMWAKEKR